MRNKLVTKEDIQRERPDGFFLPLKRKWWNFKEWMEYLVPTSVKYKYWELVAYDYRPGQLYYRAKCFLWKRYTVVHPKGSGYSWMDRCQLLPECMFQILSDFVENEGVEGIVEWYGDHPHTVKINGVEVNVMDEILALYNWWHLKYKKAYKEIDDAWHDKIYKFRGEDIFKPVANQDGDIIYYEWEREFVSDEAEEYYHKNLRLIWDMEASIAEELEEKLCRLIKIRRFLWT